MNGKSFLARFAERHGLIFIGDQHLAKVNETDLFALESHQREVFITPSLPHLLSMSTPENYPKQGINE